MTPKSVRRGGTGRELDGAGKGEGAEKRWERSRRMRLRGGEKRGGDGLTTSKGRSAMLPRLSVYILISLPVLLVQGSTADKKKSPATTPATPPPRPPAPLGDPSWALGLRLYQALRSDSGSVNTVFSPLLVASSLGALGGGSAGTTASQLQDLLKTSSPAKTGAHAGELVSTALESFAKANGTSFHLHSVLGSVFQASSSGQSGVCEGQPSQVQSAASATGERRLQS
ncbi:Serpin H1 [Larimichthys crocea]|uniref:Uncharacterized protein n=1 Tax=Larimichthys crocea TaxID=215358 RepID=A0ACD3Q4A6_LARCR|nr:Serpin H1 [Larimichthys crocea]